MRANRIKLMKCLRGSCYVPTTRQGEWNWKYTSAHTLMLEPGGLVYYCLLIRIYLAKGNNSSVINPPLFHLILVLATKKGTVLAISYVDFKTKAR